MLKQTETGACTFLAVESGKCSIYNDRPLVCRVFPLGRELLIDGSERYFPSDGEARPGGKLTQEGTVGDFLETQGVAPFAKAADEYFYWLCNVAHHLDTDVFVTSQLDDADTALALAWVDIDTVVASSGVVGMSADSPDLEDRKRYHLAFLNQILDEHVAISKNDKRDQPDQVERAAGLRRLLLAIASVLAARLGVISGQ
jgi:uncharacterized protein